MRALAMSRVLVVPLAVATLAVATLAMPLAAQSRADTTFAVARTGVLDVTLRSGSVQVRGTDRAVAELRADGVNYELTTSSVGVTLTSPSRGGRSNNRRGRDDDPRIELLVPRGVRLIISAGSGDVDVQEITGDVEVQSVSGNISLRAIGGRAIVETLSGDIEIRDGVGDLRATTMSGDITARDVRGSAEVHTTSGTVDLGMLRASSVKVESISGDILVDGLPADNASFQLATHSGDITLRMPDGARGVLDVSTFNGEVTTNSTLTLTSSGVPSSGRRERTGQRFEFGGGGSTRITVATFSGDIRLQRSSRRTPE